MLTSKRVEVFKGSVSPALCGGVVFLFLFLFSNLFLLMPVEVFAFGSSGGPPPPLVVTDAEISLQEAQILNGINGLTTSTGEGYNSGSGINRDVTSDLINIIEIIEDKNLSKAEAAEQVKIDRTEGVVLASKHSLVANDEDRIDIKKTGELVRKVNLAYFERDVRLVDLMSEKF